MYCNFDFLWFLTVSGQESNIAWPALNVNMQPEKLKIKFEPFRLLSNEKYAIQNTNQWLEFHFLIKFELYIDL